MLLFEVWNYNYDWLGEDHIHKNLDDAENDARELSEIDPHGRMYSVQKVVEINDYPDRKIVSVWQQGNRAYKTHRFDEEIVA